METMFDTKFFHDSITDRSMTHRELAKRMGLSPSQLSLMLNGKRRMQLGEAVRLAESLNVTLGEVLTASGLDPAQQRGAYCKVVGYLRGNGEVDPVSKGEPSITALPDGLSDECVAVQARTADTPLLWMDGFIMFCDAPEPPETCIDRFVRAKIEGGSEVIATIRRGYAKGTYNLSGPITLESQRLEWASRVILTRH